MFLIPLNNILLNPYKLNVFCIYIIFFIMMTVFQVLKKLTENKQNNFLGAGKKYNFKPKAQNGSEKI